MADTPEEQVIETPWTEWLKGERDYPKKGEGMSRVTALMDDAYRQGYRVAKQEDKDLLVALEAAESGFDELVGYLRRHGHNSELAMARSIQCHAAIALARGGG